MKPPLANLRDDTPKPNNSPTNPEGERPDGWSGKGRNRIYGTTSILKNAIITPRRSQGEGSVQFGAFGYDRWIGLDNKNRYKVFVGGDGGVYKLVTPFDATIYAGRDSVSVRGYREQQDLILRAKLIYQRQCGLSRELLGFQLSSP